MARKTHRTTPPARPVVSHLPPASAAPAGEAHQPTALQSLGTAAMSLAQFIGQAISGGMQRGAVRRLEIHDRIGANVVQGALARVVIGEVNTSLVLEGTPEAIQAIEEARAQTQREVGIAQAEASKAHAESRAAATGRG